MKSAFVEGNSCQKFNASSFPPGSGQSVEVGAPHADLFYLPAWQAERAARLEKICVAIQQKVASGAGLVRSMRRFAGYYRRSPRHYRAEPSRAIHFSFPTIRRAFYARKQRGADALRLNYRSGRERISQENLKHFVSVALATEATSLRSVYALLQKPAATLSAYRHALGADMRRRLSELFRRRRLALTLRRRTAELEKSFTE